MYIYICIYIYIYKDKLAKLRPRGAIVSGPGRAAKFKICALGASFYFGKSWAGQHNLNFGEW